MQFPIVPALLIAVLLSGCGGITPPAANTSESVSACGVFAADGQSCFETAMASCANSTVMLFDRVPPVSAKIVGPASGGSSCSVTLRGMSQAEIDKTMLDNSASQWEVDDMNAKIANATGFSTLEGESATCVVDKLKVREFASSYIYSCSGPLIDDINRLGLAKRFN